MKALLRVKLRTGKEVKMSKKKKMVICSRYGIPCIFAPIPKKTTDIKRLPCRHRIANACLVAAKMFAASNHAKCGKCGDIIVSTSVHDYKTCKCGNISVDGGNDYFRASAKEPQHFLRFINGKWMCGLKTKKSPTPPPDK